MCDCTYSHWTGSNESNRLGASSDFRNGGMEMHPLGCDLRIPLPDLE